MVLTAAELGSDTVLTVEELKAFSVYANLAPSSKSPVIMSLPCVQGMGMVTAIYNDAKPVIKSGVFFRSLDFIAEVSSGTYKWRTTLNDNSQWLIYVTPVGSVGIPPFVRKDESTIEGPSGFRGLIQVTKNPAGGSGEDAFDLAAGTYATNATIIGSVNGGTGSYSLNWGKGGVQSKTLLMYALPHHVESFDQQTKGALKDIKLVTTTKGYAQAVLADSITMLENDLPDTIGFAPWVKNPNGGTGGSGNVNLGAAPLALVSNAAHGELSQNFIEQTKLNSMYYSGKGLAKFASILYTTSNIAGNRNLAASGLVKLKDAFNVFVNNTQPEPLLYDKVWKGVVSSATYREGDPGLDFGNTLYNDHHFHYGYFVYTAAVIGFLDPEWLDQGSNKAWVNTLVRDFANPVTDEFFPFQRSFDWFHGHSWAKGLFESGDGKDQESTSEDTFATYALKMWGKIIRDPNMEARGNLQLAVQARSIRNYFLMTSDNKNQPENFLHNKVTGILFENKIDHTTYFGANAEFIEGIHMIPLNPSSAYTRPKRFVQEEWDTYFSNGRVDQVQGGWKAILWANYALINPQRAYDFFADPNFDTPLDGGASRTWYLTYTAALLAAQNTQAESDPGMNYTTGIPDVDGGVKQDDEEEGVMNDDQDVNGPDGNGDGVKTGTWPVGFVWPKKGDAEEDTTPTYHEAPSTQPVSTPTKQSTQSTEEDEPTDFNPGSSPYSDWYDSIDGQESSHSPEEAATSPLEEDAHYQSEDEPYEQPQTQAYPQPEEETYPSPLDFYNSLHPHHPAAPDMSWGLQDEGEMSDVEGRSSDDEWDYDWDCDEVDDEYWDQSGPQDGPWSEYDDAWKRK